MDRDPLEEPSSSAHSAGLVVIGAVVVLVVGGRPAGRLVRVVAAMLHVYAVAAKPSMRLLSAPDDAYRPR